MIATTYYESPSMEIWQGRPDALSQSTFFQLISPVDLNAAKLPSLVTPAFALLGFCCDEGIRRNHGRVGAIEGPAAIRKALAPLAAPTPDLICYDAGNIICRNAVLEEAQSALSDAVAFLLQQNITPIVLGGGHELAWGHYQGIAKIFAQEKLGIINFDAHFDMRPLLPNDLGSSGTPFLQMANAAKNAARLFDYNCIGIQRAGNTEALFAAVIAHDIHFLLAENLFQDGVKVYSDWVNDIIARNDILYLSLCLDVFAAPFAPGVSAPQAFGLTPWQIIPFVRQLASSGKVKSYDLAELSPRFDIDSRTAKLAANFIYEIISSHLSGHSHGKNTTS